MYGLEEIQKINAEYAESYRKTYPAKTRLRYRLHNLGTTTPKQNSQIEALFDLLSPALQEVFVDAAVKNEELVPVTGFSPIWVVEVRDPDIDVLVARVDVPGDTAEDAIRITKEYFGPTGRGCEFTSKPSEPGVVANADRLMGSVAREKPPHSS